MQYVISRYRVFNYLSKYATKPESRSQRLKPLYSIIMGEKNKKKNKKKLKDNESVLKFVQQKK